MAISSFGGKLVACAPKFVENFRQTEARLEIQSFAGHCDLFVEKSGFLNHQGKIIYLLIWRQRERKSPSEE